MLDYLPAVCTAAQQDHLSPSLTTSFRPCQGGVNGYYRFNEQSTSLCVSSTCAGRYPGRRDTSVFG